MDSHQISCQNYLFDNLFLFFPVCFLYTLALLACAVFVFYSIVYFCFPTFVYLINSWRVLSLFLSCYNINVYLFPNGFLSYLISQKGRPKANFVKRI